MAAGITTVGVLTTTTREKLMAEGAALCIDDYADWGGGELQGLLQERLGLGQ